MSEAAEMHQHNSSGRNLPFIFPAMLRNARGKLSLVWHGLHAHRYTGGWSKRPVKEMLWVKGLRWQQRILPLLPTCQCVHTASYLASKMVLTTMQDHAAFKCLPPVQKITKLQGFQELLAALTPAMQHSYQWTGQTEASGYIHKQSAEAHEHGNSMHYTNAEFLPILSTRNWIVPNCLWGQIIQVANLYSHYSTDAHSVTSQLPPEDLSGTSPNILLFSVSF